MVAPGTGRLEKVTWPECWEAREGEMKRSKRGREFSDRRRKGVFCGTEFDGLRWFWAKIWRKWASEKSMGRRKGVFCGTEFCLGEGPWWGKGKQSVSEDRKGDGQLCPHRVVSARGHDCGGGHRYPSPLLSGDERRSGLRKGIILGSLFHCQSTVWGQRA